MGGKRDSKGNTVRDECATSPWAPQFQRVLVTLSLQFDSALRESLCAQPSFSILTSAEWRAEGVRDRERLSQPSPPNQPAAVSSPFGF